MLFRFFFRLLTIGWYAQVCFIVVLSSNSVLHVLWSKSNKDGMILCYLFSLIPLFMLF